MLLMHRPDSLRLEPNYFRRNSHQRSAHLYPRATQVIIIARSRIAQKPACPPLPAIRVSARHGEPADLPVHPVRAHLAEPSLGRIGSR
eukprot:5250806-Alexandrium_andersonii.AAC.1